LTLETIPESIELKYVLEEIESHINDPLAFKLEEKIEQENTRLRTMLFHFTGKME